MHLKKQIIILTSGIIFLSGILTAFPEEGTPQPLSLYEEQFKTLSPKDADGHYNLALWCREKGLLTEMRARLRWVVRLNPNHKNARELLGHVKDANSWLPKELAGMERKNGLIKYKEEWMLDGTGNKMKYVSAKDELIKRKNWPDAWVLRTEHYSIRTNTDPVTAFNIGKTMESVYNTFFDVFDYDVTLSEPVEPLLVNIYKDQNDYATESAKILGAGGMAGDAFFFDEAGINACVAGELEQNLYHEGCHQLVYACAGLETLAPLTIWFNEGIGEYFEYSKPSAGNRLNPGGMSKELDALKSLVKENRHIPFERFLSLSQNEFMANDAAYSQGWGMVHFLMEYKKNKYRQRFLAYIESCKTGAGTEKFLQAMQGTGLAQLENEWKEYILNLQFR